MATDLLKISPAIIHRMHDIVNPRTPIGEAEIKDVAHAVLLLCESLNHLQDHLPDVIDEQVAARAGRVAQHC